MAYALQSRTNRSRVGWVVPKMGMPAVLRNRLKRRIREAARLLALPRMVRAQTPMDVVFVARKSAYGAGYARIAEDMERVAARLSSREYWSA